MRPVAILAAAQTRHVARRDDANYAELAFEVVRPCLDRARIDHTRIDTVVTASSDFWDGRTISDMAVQDAVGAAGKSASKVSMDGVFALSYAAARVNSGAYRTCLVVAHGKASEGNPRAISTAAFDPIFERPLGLDDHAALGLQASFLLGTDVRNGRLSEADLAQAAAEAWTCSSRNPNAHRREARTPEQVLASPMADSPLREDMIAPDSDGACAILLADEETGRREGATVWLEGFGAATWPHPLGTRGFRYGAIRTAAAEAVRQARLEKTGAIDVVEVHDASSAQSILWRRALDLRADVDFNPSGGAMGAQPGFATGLVRVAEVYERLARGEGKVGLAHGQTGFVGQSHGVWILRRA